MDDRVKEVRRLVIDASSAESSPSERQESFREIVIRFQDLAYACAYGVLGDSWLAEDVAQEAFITAWQKLNQLRKPEAFPGWFRQIVLSECYRLTRGKKLQFIPLDSAEFESRNVASESDPEAHAELNELRANVREAIKALPERERLITTLFYLNEYSQREIGAFLELPVSTIVKRLYSARQRLKQGMIEMLEDDLQRHRPSRNNSFAEQVSARLRPPVEGDWEPISAFVYGLTPDFRQDDETWLHSRQQFDESKYTRRHYVAEHFDTGQILGYGSIEQTVFRPKYRLFLMAEPHWLNAGVGDLLLDQLMKDLDAAGAITVGNRTYSNLTALLDFLLDRSFIETSRVCDLRLDLSATDLPILAGSAAELTARGITITTFAEERQQNAEAALHNLHQFLNLVKQDDAARQPFIAVPFESVAHWATRQYVLADACFIAKHGSEYIGFTDLNLLEPIPGAIMHGFTGVAREWRRQGVAKALKLRAIEYARDHGYQTIRALNLPRQPEMMALNEKLGFRCAFSYVTVEKFVKQAADIDPAAYDSYVGEYAGDASALIERGLPANLTITIKKTGDRLISELRDMQDELFPESDDAFFTDHHYARFVFGRDERGSVMHLIYCEGEKEWRASKVS